MHVDAAKESNESAVASAVVTPEKIQSRHRFAKMRHERMMAAKTSAKTL